MSAASGLESLLKVSRSHWHANAGFGYDDGDPYAGFLPPPVEVNAEGESNFMRAVVVITEETEKGTARSHQEYVNPLLVLSGRAPMRQSRLSVCTSASVTLYGAKGRGLWHSPLRPTGMFSSSYLTGRSSTVGSDEL